MKIKEFILEYLYYCIYRSLKETKSAAQAEGVTAGIMVIAPLIPLGMFFVYIDKEYGYPIEYERVKSIIFMAFAFIGYLSWAYYIRDRNDERIIRCYSKRVKDKTAINVGGFVMILTCFFPFIVYGIAYLLNKLMVLIGY